MPPSRIRASKVQRWIDLMAALLVRRTPATFDELAAHVPEYSSSGKSRETLLRMFERDKDELRRFGVPIETVPLDVGERSGYRLSGRGFYLPYLSVASTRARGRGGTSRVPHYGYRALESLAFEPDELEAIAAGAELVRTLPDPVLAAEAESAMRKLALDLPLAVAKSSLAKERAAPRRERMDEVSLAQLVDGDVLGDLSSPASPPATAEPPRAATAAGDILRAIHELPPARVSAPRAQPPLDRFALLSDALARRKLVAFDEWSSQPLRHRAAVVEPFGLTFAGSSWTLAARDRDSGEIRQYPIDALHDLVVNPRHATERDYEIPASFDLRSMTAQAPWRERDPDGGAHEAIVEFRAITAQTIAAAALGAEIAGAPERRAYAVRDYRSFARWLLGFGGDAVPVAPPALVEELTRQAAGARARYGGEAGAG
jgi:predicted DNA-binding transcriptional regulator YafY